jgi:hypothetical protein
MTGLLHAGHAVSGNAELVVAAVFLVAALTLLAWPNPARGTPAMKRRRRRTVT